MDTSEALDGATKQLDRLLAFFPRVEGKATALFGVNVAFLALACLNLRFEDLDLWRVSLPLLGGVLTSLVSMVHVYRCMFPHLKGPAAKSLVYFRDIADHTEVSYREAFKAQPTVGHLDDLLSQVWRNSEILKAKFRALEIAFAATAVSVLPWTIFLAATSILRSEAPTIG